MMHCIMDKHEISVSEDNKPISFCVVCDFCHMSVSLIICVFFQSGLFLSVPIF